MALLNFNAATVAPSEGAMSAIPAGWYNAAIDESEMKPTKDGNGAYLQLRFTIIDGQYANRKVFTRLNLQNANPVAQKIAYEDLSAICHAIGQMQVAESAQLHGIPMKVKVKLRAASGEYEASNEINSYKNINHAVEMATGTAPGIQAPQITPPQQGIQPPAQQQQFQQPVQQQQFQQPVQQQQFQQPVQQQQMQQPVQQPVQQYQQAQQPWQQPAGAEQQPVQQQVMQQQQPVQQMQQQAPQQHVQQQHVQQQQMVQQPMQQQQYVDPNAQMQQQPMVQQAQQATPPWQQAQ